ncbi:NAD(P)-binding protein [Polyporus arcularius HHB13444]|uniref:NAD(P)-binding protein n=1 Tax=Polyporus arcularius HHB13444 TaxID=1314778 RepID=A0A5C3PG75_9APHY|nr:NAD(P)-binding protein [Polyporus arcularius HHB13444]
MPAITSGKVLVTGANGYVAAWVLKDLLENGFAVRGTVRSESKAAHLRAYFKAFGDKLDFVVVDDITKDGAFDEAAAEVDAVMHIASPVTATAADPEDVIGPAVRGTTSLLNSVLKHQTTIKRVFVMSSTAAVFSPPLSGSQDKTAVLDEKDWNELSVQHVKEKGKEADGMHVYRASKVLAERAAWDVYEREKAHDGGLGWDLVTFCAPFVFGPVIHEVSSPESLGGSQGLWYRNVVKGAAKGALTKLGYEWVDVRDLARAHTLALVTPSAGGERFIIRGGRAVWQDFVNAARKYTSKVPAGDPDYNPDNAFFPSTYIADKSVRILGIRYRSIEELTKDSLDDFAARGWL